MVNNQYGNLKFGAGEMALLCAKSLFRYHISVTKGISVHGEQPVWQPQVWGGGDGSPLRQVSVQVMITYFEIGRRYAEAEVMRILLSNWQSN
jgi:hypothetical protein